VNIKLTFDVQGSAVEIEAETESASPDEVEESLRPLNSLVQQIVGRVEAIEGIGSFKSTSTIHLSSLVVGQQVNSDGAVPLRAPKQVLLGVLLAWSLGAVVHHPTRCWSGIRG